MWSTKMQRQQRYKQQLSLPPKTAALWRALKAVTTVEARPRLQQVTRLVVRVAHRMYTVSHTLYFKTLHLHWPRCTSPSATYVCRRATRCQTCVAPLGVLPFILIACILTARSAAALQGAGTRNTMADACFPGRLHNLYAHRAEGDGVMMTCKLNTHQPADLALHMQRPPAGSRRSLLVWLLLLRVATAPTSQRSSCSCCCHA